MKRVKCRYILNVKAEEKELGLSHVTTELFPSIITGLAKVTPVGKSTHFQINIGDINIETK